MGSNICTKYNNINLFGRGPLNKISYIMANLKYIILIIEKQISIYKNVRTNICADVRINL